MIFKIDGVSLPKSGGLMRAAVRKSELVKIVPLSFYAIDKLEKAGEFPRRFPLTERVVAWNRDEVEAWLDARQQNSGTITRDPGMIDGLKKTWAARAKKSDSQK
ncbi:AlpA family phage regulatory protein [uncultured Klebsiella sp.]|uniref:helix-turn-helix transcriptional regulator n=1 Tax=uncultured Klebsiella sp. TaxID=284011 RepID=UPI002803F356|nr:AlpA family phage regulatory protein [uncultured Klebsiella sp.]